MVDIQFGEKSSYTDWGLLLSPQFSVGIPPVKTQRVDIPAGDGSIDLTEGLMGRAMYGDRALSFGFILPAALGGWEEKRRELVKYLHGKSMPIKVPDMPDHHFSGRCECGELVEYGSAYAEMGISAVCDPWIYRDAVTAVAVSIGGSGEQEVTLSNEERPVPLIVETEATGIIIYRGADSWAVSPGVTTLATLVLAEGETLLRVEGANGDEVTLSYLEARL